MDARPAESAPRSISPAPDSLVEWNPPADEVLRYCRSRLSSSADAEDAAQETLLRACALRHGGEQTIGWFIKTAGFVCSEVRRRNARVERDALMAARAARPDTDPERIVVSDVWLRHLFNSLSPDDQTLLSDLYLRDGAPAKLAARLGLSPGGLRMAAMRARQRARDAIGLIGGLAPLVAGLVARMLQKLRTRLYRLRSLNTAPLSNSSATLIGETPVALLVGTAAVIGLALAPPANLLPNAPLWGTSKSSASASTPALQSGRGNTSISGGVNPQPMRSPAGPSPSPAPSGDAASLMQGIVEPGQNATPQQANITTFTPSPNYSHDHTVFASGVLGTGCSSTCDVLFESSDTGKSWRHLPGAGYLGSEVLLAPTFPSDPTVYALGPAGLQRSPDHGGTFVSLIPEVNVAAPIPTAGSGDTSFLLGEVPLASYDATTGTFGGGPLLPPGVDAVDAVAYVGSVNDLVVAAKEIDPRVSGQQDEVLLQCTTSACTNRFTLPDNGPPTLIASLSATGDRTLVVAAGAQGWITRDGGSIFTSLGAMGNGNQIVSAAIDPAFAETGTLALATLPEGRDPSGAFLLLSHDAGTTLTAVATSGLPASSFLRTLEVLPGGVLLGAPWGTTLSSQLGIRCSTDWGAHWAPAC